MNKRPPLVRGHGRASPDALRIHSGVNQREALVHAQRLGATIEQPRRTGELRVRHPLMARSVLCNGRRRDASRALTGWIRQLEAILSAKARMPKGSAEAA